MTIQRDVDFNRLIADNVDFFASGGVRGARLRWCEEAIFEEAYDEAKWQVRSREDSWSFDEVFTSIDAADEDAGVINLGRKGNLRLWSAPVRPPKSGIMLGDHVAWKVSETEFLWNDRRYKINNYKGKRIPIPDNRMWGWFEQRKIKVFKLNPNADNNEDFDGYDRVVFGTKTDNYTAFPEKYGFMGRRSIANAAGANWKDEYENRLRTRNPRRGQSRGKWTVGVGDAQKQNRWDENQRGIRPACETCSLHPDEKSIHHQPRTVSSRCI